MSGPIDRRVRRTRELLRRSLLELMLEKRYDRITVQDILDRADVGRSTFYAHFQGKDQLLLSGWEVVRASIEEALASEEEEEGTAALLSPLRELFRHAAEHRPLYRAMIGGRVMEMALRSARRALSGYLAAHLRAHTAIRDEVQLDIAVSFLASAFQGLVTWWLDEQPSLPADDMYERFERLALGGLDRFLSA